MIKMSFYNGTLDRAKAARVVESTNKKLCHRQGYAYRGAVARPITKNDALRIIGDRCGIGELLDIKESETEIELNTFSSNDMW